MKKAILLVLAIVSIIIVGNFIPLSLRGPAMSCMTAANETENDKKTLEFAASHDFALNAVSDYLANSDFRLRNVSTKGNVVTLVFEKNKRNNVCFLTDFFAIDGSLVIVDVTPENKVSPHYN